MTGQARMALPRWMTSAPSPANRQRSRDDLPRRQRPGRALDALRPVLDGTAPVIGYVAVVEAHLLAGLAHRPRGDKDKASQAADNALALAEADGWRCRSR